MDLGLLGKHVLISGASRGIGRAIALRLAQEGAKVTVVARASKVLDEVIDAMGSAEQGHLGIGCDLTQVDAVKNLAVKLRKLKRLPDIVVNNIGDTLGVIDPYCSIADWRRVMRINFEIALEINHMVLPAMKKRQWGRIVHVASNASLENSGPVTYCVAKAALAQYATTLGQQVAKEGIVVSSIMPGAIVAPGSYWDRTAQTRPEHVKRYVQERLPLGRFGKPEEISGMVALMCSPKSSYLASNSLGVDGSQSKHFFGLY